MRGPFSNGELEFSEGLKVSQENDEESIHIDMLPSDIDRKSRSVWTPLIRLHQRRTDNPDRKLPILGFETKNRLMPNHNT